jgi:hypothetical protein
LAKVEIIESFTNAVEIDQSQTMRRTALLPQKQTSQALQECLHDILLFNSTTHQSKIQAEPRPADST